MRQKIIVMSILMWSVSDASLPQFPPTPLDPTEVLSVEKVNCNAVLDRVFNAAEDELTSPLYKQFKQSFYNLSKDFETVFYKAKVAELLYGVSQTKHNVFINTYKILITFIATPTEVDRFHILKALSQAPLTSHFPYPPFVDFCKDFNDPSYSFSLIVLTLSTVPLEQWTGFKKYAMMIHPHKTEIALILASITSDRWEQITLAIVEHLKINPAFFSQVELEDLIFQLKKTQDTKLFQLLNSFNTSFFDRAPYLLGSE